MESEGLKAVVGMTVSYLASLAGMFFAWYHYRKRQRTESTPPARMQGNRR